MPGRTRLYQRAGSPLIHGRSRFERSWTAEWAAASVASVAGLYAVHAAATLLGSARNAFTTAAAREQWVLGPLPGAGAAVVAALAGVWLARALGWRAAWLGGAALGVTVGVVLTILWGRAL